MKSEVKSFSRVLLFETPWTVQPTRLLCPWDSPGKNTGVGCHALFQRYKSPQELLENTDGQDSGPDLALVVFRTP